MVNQFIYSPPNPENSSLEKLLIPNKERSLWKLEQGIMNSGLESDIARKLIQAFKTYETERQYEDLRNYQELEYWGNSHTHPGGEAVVTGWPYLGSYLYIASFFIATQEDGSTDVTFSPDGTKMYITGYLSDSIHRYNLATPWEITSAVFVNSFSVASQQTFPHGVKFSPDGTKMYTVGTGGDYVHQYNLATAWDATTAVYVNLFYVAPQDTSPLGLDFAPDGTKMYIVGTAGDSVYRYDLATAWDISTATYINSFSVAVEETGPTGIKLTPDGTRLYIIGADNDAVHRYNLITPWDITTAVYVESFIVTSSSGENVPSGIDFNPDGTKMYIIGSSSDSVHQYNSA